MDKAWKRTERCFAAMIGGQRVPITGRQRGATPDIEHDHLSPEVKLRAKLPGWLHDAMDQAEQSATGGRTPCVFLKQNGQQYRSAFVVFRVGDFLDRYMPDE